ncbi:hypothetical protein C8R45DRAFT_82429 [Mycena sanguinolenta]|nr:hypothetical protein C8R45DRAFT_82429 [Mycena sanguinolenta]
MVTDSPPDDGALLIPCTDIDAHFSFTSCPHSSHGFVCTTSPQPHEIQDSRKHSVYPSPPPTNSQPKRNVPLPTAARYQQYQFGGVLDSPVVLMKAPAHTLWSPPPTIPTPTHALPPADPQDNSLLLPILEQHECPSPRPTTPQLLSPISPEWAPNRKPEDLFAVDDSGDSVLMSQSGAYDYPFAADVDDDILGGAGPFGRPALHPLDIPMYHTKRMHDDEDPAGQPGVLLGFHGMMPEHLVGDATSPFEYVPPSPSSLRDFDSISSESDLDDLDLGLDSSPGPSSYSPSPLRSFASLPSPDLDDLDLDMDLGPGLGMSPSPSRRSVASLPSFDDSEPYIFSDFSYETDSSSSSSYEGADELLEESPDPTMSPPPSEPSPLPLDVPPQNALCLDLPIDATPAKAPPPSILDAFTPAELTERLPPYLPQSELDALLAVRTRAHIALAACTAAPAVPSGSDSVGLSLDLELRRTVPRDAGEPRRRRKRAKALGREVDAIVGLALGLLPPSPSLETPSSAQQQQQLERERERKAVKDKATGATTLRRDKAGLAGLASMPQLVARMILRRRERCVRGLDGGGGRGRVRVSSPLRTCFSLEGDEPPPAMMMDLDTDE